jgi:hypothetical protein
VVCDIDAFYANNLVDLATSVLLEVKDGDNDLRRLRDEVLQLVRRSAEAEGRVVSPFIRDVGYSELIACGLGSGLSCTTSLVSEEKT